MSPAPKNPPDPEPAPAPTPSDEPDWARRLRESIESLPGKLTATVSDDDRRSIAESVHGLFESSGAFKQDPEPGDPESDPEPTPDPPAPDRNPGESDSFARRLFGRW
jgi:hypothetical protein